MRGTHLRRHDNIIKRLLIHAGAFNLGLVMRKISGCGTPRGFQGRLNALLFFNSAAVESLCKRHIATMASIRGSRGNFAEKRDAFSNACSLPASRHSVFENQFSHGLLAENGKWDHRKVASIFLVPGLALACQDNHGSSAIRPEISGTP
jgi:hypothetical protein